MLIRSEIKRSVPRIVRSTIYVACKRVIRNSQRHCPRCHILVFVDSDVRCIGTFEIVMKAFLDTTLEKSCKCLFFFGAIINSAFAAR